MSTSDPNDPTRPDRRDQVCHATIRLPVMLSLATVAGAGLVAAAVYLVAR